jgi:hypothetical protein
MEDKEGLFCRICDSPIDDSGTEEEEKAAGNNLCSDCYTQKHEDEDALGVNELADAIEKMKS